MIPFSDEIIDPKSYMAISQFPYYFAITYVALMYIYYFAANQSNEMVSACDTLHGCT